MPPSYRQVHFTLRPAKAAQRKMIIEACGHLGNLAEIRSFRYIGLGSPFFNDFSALHRRYGIHDMICVEKQVSDRDRFAFNLPYDCIDMSWGESHDVLPTLDWKGIPTIIWMDYDGSISPNILSDISTVFSSIDPFGLAMFTVQADGRSFGNGELSPLEDLKSRLRDYVPSGAESSDMAGKKFQKLVRQIIDDEIRRILSQRNAAAEAADRMVYRQLFNFLYRDEVWMTTIGGVMFSDSLASRVDRCKFDTMKFARMGNDPYEVKIPILTHKEQRHLSSAMPSGDIGHLGLSLPEREVRQYHEIYRHYPVFIETDL